MDEFYKELLKEIEKRKLKNVDSVLKLRRNLCRKYHPKILPTIIDILLHANNKQFKKLKFLVTKPSRTISGVTPIAIMTKPYPCPHGKCIMCPGGPSSVFGDVPQSYTGKEPSTMRSKRNHYDPYLTVFNRLEQYYLLNQPYDKIELIIQGGTFSALPIKYQNEFITYALKAMNDFKFTLEKFKQFFELPSDLSNERTKRIQNKILKLKGKTKLKKEQKRNETSNVRCIGLTIETRPDYATLNHANIMLEQGCTRVELGVQTTDDKVLKFIKRGHSVKDSIDAFRTLKDLGFKINAHIMLGLPGDKNDLMKIFGRDFRPDMLKIYPCMVMPGTELEKIYLEKKFQPLTTEEVIKILAKFKQKVPDYVKIMRIQRDIPTNCITAGVDKTNLRQMLHEYMKKNNLHCNCIRCNEIKSKIKKPKLKVKKYLASKGTEFFISIKQEKEIIGFCRLRFPSQFLKKEITKDSAIIRELHVLGTATPIESKGDVQHRGFGKKLLKEAEKICKQNKKKKILIISGIGAREYYKKQGYKQDGPYVSKIL